MKPKCSGSDVRTMDSSCSTYRVGKLHSIFHFRSIKNYSVILLFRYSVFCILQRPSIYSIRSGESLSVVIRTEQFEGKQVTIE